jgi:hypothetical protein
LVHITTISHTFIALASAEKSHPRVVNHFTSLISPFLSRRHTAFPDTVAVSHIAIRSSGFVSHAAAHIPIIDASMTAFSIDIDRESYDIFYD